MNANSINKSNLSSIGFLADEEFINTIGETDLIATKEGGLALNNLNELGGGKLSEQDVEIIARNLYKPLQKLKQHLRQHEKDGLGKFCVKNKIADESGSSRELHRLVLPPGKFVENVRLRRAADKYYRLICGIAETVGVNRKMMADRVLRGTSLHPAISTESFTEAELLADALQLTVDKIDQEFGIYNKFIEIMKIKAQHLSGGGNEHWPLWEVSGDECNDINPKHAFWRNYTEVPDLYDNGFPNYPMSGALQNSEFFYIPHAPLGVIEFANISRRSRIAVDSREYESMIKNVLDGWRSKDDESGQSWIALEYAIKDHWNDEEKCPIGQVNFHNGKSYGSYFSWLIIYPTRDNSGLMPMIYIPYEEGGPYIVPLNARNLEIFRDAIWLNEFEDKSFYDRIKELLGCTPTEERQIENGLRKTAPWLDWNPVFKIRLRQEEDMRMLKNFCAKLQEEKGD